MPLALDDIVSERLDPADIEDRYLRHFLDLWSAARGVDPVTRKSSMPPELLGPAQPDVSLIEVRTGSFVFRQIGHRIRALHLQDYVGCSLDEVEPAAFRDICQIDYRAVLREAAPGYNRIATRTSGRRFTYDRLLLPLSRDGRRVDWLLAVATTRQDWREAFRSDPERAIA